MLVRWFTGNREELLVESRTPFLLATVHTIVLIVSKLSSEIQSVWTDPPSIWNSHKQDPHSTRFQRRRRIRHDHGGIRTWTKSLILIAKVPFWVSTCSPNVVARYCICNDESQPHTSHRMLVELLLCSVEGFSQRSTALSKEIHMPVSRYSSTTSVCHLPNNKPVVCWGDFEWLGPLRLQVPKC